ncbi:MAG: magnesium transporter [Lactobacillus sp.]|uniref:magnesium transporter n=1 Tax=Bombilactobacillus bombi TaxID=1303590 RepID=UPI000E589D2C|nr:magnesium transporter [Bombilactobacillus bombi]AXX64853.1 magnesium transporter [Bombilactobacillus bombi]MCO6541803.1 magnesium transporter [Lactobacillus sp.]MCO6543238.1 magnesium transporter [Lactobacillus sp.]
MQELQNQINLQFHKLRKLLDEQHSKQFRKRFLDMHFYEQGQFFLTLNHEQRLQLYQIMAPDEVGDMFDTLEDDQIDMSKILAEMDLKYASDVLNSMYDDNAADFLEHLDKSEVDRYLALMPRADANQLRGLLHYDTQTAGGLMTTDYVVMRQDLNVKEALDLLRKFAHTAETIYYLYVIDDDNDLVGTLSLRELFTHNEKAVLSTIMTSNVISVFVDDDQEAVAQVFRDYQFVALPVVDHAHKLMGIVTVDDVIEVIDDEAQDDYSKLAGVDVDESKSTPLKAASSRLPWLITLLFLGMITATLIAHFEDLLSQASILAVFISLITGTAGNAGTQSLAVAVRRLSLTNNKPQHLWGLLLKELVTGLVIGLITGMTIMIVVGIWKHSFVLGAVIGLAMMAAITVANLAGSLIPMLMAKIGFDPAVASGPFISTLSDLTSVLIYFNIASLFMGFFKGM